MLGDKTRRWWLIGAGVAGLGFCLLLCCGGVAAVLVYGNAARAKTPYTRDEFNRRFTGASIDEVRQVLGGPDTTSAGLPGGGEGYWAYYKRTVNPKTGRTDDVTTLWWEGHRVAEISYLPP